MKNLFFSLFFLFSLNSCASYVEKFLASENNIQNKADNEQEEEKEVELPYENKNPKCIYNIKNVEIFQTLDVDHGLALYDRDGQSFKTALFSLPYSFLDKVKLYDGLRIELPEKRCFVVSDTYKYETKEGDYKVVPVITFGYEYDAKDKEEFIERIEKEANGLKQLCSFSSKEEIKKQGFKSVKQCECYVKTAFDVDNLIKLKNYTKYSEKKKIDELDKLIKQVEKKCGKLQKPK